MSFSLFSAVCILCPVSFNMVFISVIIWEPLLAQETCYWNLGKFWGSYMSAMTEKISVIIGC